ncbi:MAG: hypothetical protein ACLFNR_03345 [Candidatus Paceibacterota bacterium]
MFEKPENITPENEDKEKKEGSDQETEKEDHYKKILEEAYRSGASLDLPELEEFNENEVDSGSINQFSLALIDFIETKEQEADEEEVENLFQFVGQLRWKFSSNLAGFFDIKDRLKIMTRATRSGIIKKTFVGADLVGKTIRDASQTEGDLRRDVLKTMDEMPVSEKLDLLHQLRTVGAQAAIYNNRVVYNQVRETYEQLIYSADHPVFIQLAAEAGLETLKKEREQPQLSKLFDSENSSRLYTGSLDEQDELCTQRFFSKYDLDQLDPSKVTVTLAAKDGLAYRNRFGLATGVIKIDVGSFLSDPDEGLEFDVNQYRNYKEHLDKIEESRRVRKDLGIDEQNEEDEQKATQEVFHAIYDEYAQKMLSAGNAETPAKVFTEILPVLTEKEWEKYFIGEIKLQEELSFKKISDEFNDKYQKTVNEFIIKLFRHREDLGTQYLEEYTDLEKALEKDDLDQAQAIATEISMKCLDREQPSASQQEIIELWNKFNETLEKNFDEATKKYEALNTELRQSEKIKEHDEIVGKLKKNTDEIHKQLQTFIEKKLAMANDLPKLEPITLEQLTTEFKSGEDQDRVTKEEALLFQHIHSSDLSKKIENEFGFTLSDLSLREQYFFLNYLKKVKPDSAEKMKRFTATYGIDGMRTFLSLENGDESLGDDIVAFGQHDEVAETIFSYYGELLNRAEKAETLVGQISDHEEKALTELANQVRQNMVNRAQKDLEKAVRAHDPGEVAERIETYNVAAKEYVALLQEVGAGKIEATPSEEIPPEDKEQMLNLLKENYEKIYPDPEDNDFKAAVTNSLEKSFSNPNSTFYILRDKEKIVSYDRFDTIKDPSGKEISYFGSFNADPAYNGVGCIMLEETTKEKLEDGRPMMGHCDPTQDITRKYIERGFVATKYFSFEGKPSFEIWRSQDSSRQLESKNRPIEDLLNKDDSEDILVREASEPETYDELNKGMALTRYFTHQKRTYLVFEKLPQELEEAFSFEEAKEHRDT